MFDCLAYGSDARQALEKTMADYNYEKYEGLFIPTVTPFDPAGELDLKSLDRVARYQASIPGVAALVSCARIGEGTVLRPDEKMKVHEVMGRAAHDNGKVHTATIAPQCTKEAIELIRSLEKLPVDAVMIFPPRYSPGAKSAAISRSSSTRTS